MTGNQSQREARRFVDRGSLRLILSFLPFALRQNQFSVRNRSHREYDLQSEVNHKHTAHEIASIIIPRGSTNDDRFTNDMGMD